MNTQPDGSNTLLRARDLLQAVLRQHETSDPRGVDTGTLARMLVHMDNIAKSVSASRDDHVNASKRLNDFANTVERMERIAAQPGAVRTDTPIEHAGRDLARRRQGTQQCRRAAELGGRRGLGLINRQLAVSADRIRLEGIFVAFPNSHQRSPNSPAANGGLK